MTSNASVINRISKVINKELQVCGVIIWKLYFYFETTVTDQRT